MEEKTLSEENAKEKAEALAMMEQNLSIMPEPVIQTDYTLPKEVICKCLECKGKDGEVHYNKSAIKRHLRDFHGIKKPNKHFEILGIKV